MTDHPLSADATRTWAEELPTRLAQASGPRTYRVTIEDIGTGESNTAYLALGEDNSGVLIDTAVALAEDRLASTMSVALRPADTYLRLAVVGRFVDPPARGE